MRFYITETERRWIIESLAPRHRMMPWNRYPAAVKAEREMILAKFAEYVSGD